MTKECLDLKGDGSAADVVQVTINMLQTVGIDVQLGADLDVEERELQTFDRDEAEFWKGTLKDVHDSRLKMTMESHVHALSDEDLNEGDLSTLPLDAIAWLKLNRECEDEEEEEERAEVQPVEKKFHFQQFSSKERTF